MRYMIYHDDASITYYSEARREVVSHTVYVAPGDYLLMSPAVRRHVTEHLDIPNSGYPRYMPDINWRTTHEPVMSLAEYLGGND